MSLEKNAPRAAGQRTGRPSSLRINRQPMQSGCKFPRRLGNVGGDRIHQTRRQAVVGFEMQLLQSGPDRAHLIGLSADSMIEETNAANSGGAQPWSFESSVWIKSNP